MAIVKPFRALRPLPALAKKVASRPYDVLTTAEAKKEASGNEVSFLHVTKAEIDLPAETDVHAQQVYKRAKENLHRFIADGILQRDSIPFFYIYELVMNNRSQTGLVAVSAVDDYDNNIILKHEFTRPDKEQDRINHIRTTGAQTGNVFLAYRSEPGITTLIDKWKKNHQPIYNFTADDGIQHTLWVVDDDGVMESISKQFAEKVAVTYIADGHHRAASAAKVRKSLGNQKRNDADFFLTTLFPSNELQILDYNRVIKDRNGLSGEELLKKLEHCFTVTLVGKKSYKPSVLHEFGMYLEKNWYQLTSKNGTWKNDPIGVLDITILQTNVLEPLLGIKDQRTDKRIDFVGGIRGLKELETKVDSGEMALAFSLFPVTIGQLFDIADSGNVMPPKSTWFEPKLRDGLLTHLIDDGI